MIPFIRGGKNREKPINALVRILSGVYGLSKGLYASRRFQI